MQEFKGSQDYVASEELLRAANIAMVLQKPLLIKGEPGTGKTVLAEAIAKSLNKKLIIWNIKSTTKAQDGLYVYDVVQRLYDSQFGTAGVDDIGKYIKLGKLGEAFTCPGGVYGGVIFADSHRPFFRTLREGYIINTGSVGNSLGVAKAHALILEGEMDCREEAVLTMTILSVPYDNEAAAEMARQDAALPHRESFIKEVLTGVYSR